MRRRAAAILRRVDGGRGFASELLRPADPPFVRELVLGVLRRRSTLDAVHDGFARRLAAELDADVRQAVRIGLYQLLFLDGVPPHAAVSEAVALLGPKSKRAYANGLLRAVQRGCRKVDPGFDRGGASPTKRLERPGRAVFFFSRPVFPDPAHDRAGWLAAVYGHPRALVRRWIDDVGEDEARRRMGAANTVPELVLRPRAGRCSAAELGAALASERIPCQLLARETGSAAVRVSGASAGLFGGRAYRKGLFSVQDPAQMDAVEILAPRPGEVVWDVCAAPGGKTTQIAEALDDRGRVVASDVDGARLARVEQNAARLGLTCVEPVEHDALDPRPPQGMPTGGFDAVLLDAPCSNTAVLGRRPEARWRWRPETPAQRAALQARLIAAARRWLAPGGRMVYSVCSFEPEEGRDHGLVPTRSELVFEVPGASA